MEDHLNEEKQNLKWEDRAPSAATRWLVIVSVTLFAITIFAVGYAYERATAASALSDQNQMMRTAETQMRGQIDLLTAKINEMTAPQPGAAPDAKPAVAAGATGATATGKSAAKHTASAGSSTQDRRIRQMQSQLAAQQKQLKQTEDEIAGTRSNLEGKLGSTRDELNGSIARTHDELVALEKRGERNYFEFDLSKSKGFQHEGPIQISLRKADSKHQSYDLMMLVDDHHLSKKKVDLYEPIWLHQADQPQPVQIVVNQIDKNHVHGYISAPKYRESELASNAAQPSTELNARPCSTPSTDSSSYSASHTSSVPATASQAQPRPVD
ncbi:MAG: hypothetical protein LAO08_05490 [Acidobacteriia bacterium]|nr:hypothetical protein [Terriglobia bacterium]